MLRFWIIYFITQGFFLEMSVFFPKIVYARVETASQPSLVVKNVKNGAVYKEDLRKTVCTKSMRSNFRKGPDINSPVEYEVLVRGYPLKVIKFIDTWYATEDFEGNIAWISQINVKENCGAVVKVNGLAFVYFYPSVNSKIVMSLERGFIIRNVECFTKEWCLVMIDDRTGWVLRSEIWGNVKVLD